MRNHQNRKKEQLLLPDVELSDDVLFTDFEKRENMYIPNGSFSLARIFNTDV
jgi:hypothetical protein